MKVIGPIASEFQMVVWLSGVCQTMTASNLNTFIGAATINIALALQLRSMQRFWILVSQHGDVLYFTIPLQTTAVCRTISTLVSVFGKLFLHIDSFTDSAPAVDSLR